jgi:hypothetical protein
MDCRGVGGGENRRYRKGESMESTAKESCREEEEFLGTGCVLF